MTITYRELRELLKKARENPQLEGRPSLFRREIDLTLETFESIIEDRNGDVNDEFIEKLKAFLAARWNRIKNTDLAYTQDSQNPASVLCIGLAAILDNATPHNKDTSNKFELLIPDLKGALKNHVNSQHIDDYDISEIVLTDNNANFIPIKDCIDGWTKTDSHHKKEILNPAKDDRDCAYNLDLAKTNLDKIPEDNVTTINEINFKDKLNNNNTVTFALLKPVVKRLKLDNGDIVDDIQKPLFCFFAFDAKTGKPRWFGPFANRRENPLYNTTKQFDDANFTVGTIRAITAQDVAKESRVENFLFSHGASSHLTLSETEYKRVCSAGKIKIYCEAWEKDTVENAYELLSKIRFALEKSSRYGTGTGTENNADHVWVSRAVEYIETLKTIFSPENQRTIQQLEARYGFYDYHYTVIRVFNEVTRKNQQINDGRPGTCTGELSNQLHKIIEQNKTTLQNISIIGAPQLTAPRRKQKYEEYCSKLKEQGKYAPCGESSEKMSALAKQVATDFSVELEQRATKAQESIKQDNFASLCLEFCGLIEENYHSLGKWLSDLIQQLIASGKLSLDPSTTEEDTLARLLAGLRQRHKLDESSYISLLHTLITNGVIKHDDSIESTIKYLINDDSPCVKLSHKELYFLIFECLRNGTLSEDKAITLIKMLKAKYTDELDTNHTIELINSGLGANLLNQPILESMFADPDGNISTEARKNLINILYKDGKNKDNALALSEQLLTSKPFLVDFVKFLVEKNEGNKDDLIKFIVELCKNYETLQNAQNPQQQQQNDHDYLCDLIDVLLLLPNNKFDLKNATKLISEAKNKLKWQQASIDIDNVITKLFKKLLAKDRNTEADENIRKELFEKLCSVDLILNTKKFFDDLIADTDISKKALFILIKDCAVGAPEKHKLLFSFIKHALNIDYQTIKTKLSKATKWSIVSRVLWDIALPIIAVIIALALVGAAGGGIASLIIWKAFFFAAFSVKAFLFMETAPLSALGIMFGILICLILAIAVIIGAIIICSVISVPKKELSLYTVDKNGNGLALSSLDFDFDFGFGFNEVNTSAKAQQILVNQKFDVNFTEGNDASNQIAFIRKCEPSNIKCFYYRYSDDENVTGELEENDRRYKMKIVCLDAKGIEDSLEKLDDPHPVAPVV